MDFTVRFESANSSDIITVEDLLQEVDGSKRKAKIG